MRGCQPPGTGRCITAPGKVSGSRRFYVIIRGTAWTARYGGDGWDCADIPRAAGENPVGTLYINQRCAKLVKGDMRAVLETRFCASPARPSSAAARNEAIAADRALSDPDCFAALAMTVRGHRSDLTECSMRGDQSSPTACAGSSAEITTCA